MKTALIDMHNDTKFAIQAMHECLDAGMPMATVQSSLDGFLEKATESEKQEYLKYADQIQILPDLF